MVKAKTHTGRMPPYYKTLVPPASIDVLERELAHAEALRASIAAKIEERRKASADTVKVKERIASLPDQFGVRTLPEVMDLIRRHGLPPVKRQFKVTEDVEKRVLALLKNEKSGREIREIMKLSFPTIYRIKDKYGLVVHQPNKSPKAHAAQPQEAHAASGGGAMD